MRSLPLNFDLLQTYQYSHILHTIVVALYIHKVKHYKLAIGNKIYIALIVTLRADDKCKANDTKPMCKYS